MSNDVFHFKQFSVKQDRCAMKVGTDGVLLGAWCRCVCNTVFSDSPNASSHILDIGAGTGLISLMLAQRNPHSLIDAVEIDPSAASQCLDNFLASPWSSRLTVHAASLSEFNSDATPSSATSRNDSPRFSLIVSNPPFYDATLKPDDTARAVARHKDSLPVADIMLFAATHLTPSGTLALIYPIEYDDEVMTSAVLNGLNPSRLCDVFTSVRKPAKRRLAEFSIITSINTSSSLIRESILIGSPEYKALTSGFYL